MTLALLFFGAATACTTTSGAPSPAAGSDDAGGGTDAIVAGDSVSTDGAPDGRSGPPDGSRESGADDSGNAASCPPSWTVTAACGGPGGQTLWNGNGGAVFFYQSEMPYDPPDQASWSPGPGQNGYASYKVADAVTTHRAEGMGVYSVFDNDVTADDGLEAPTGSGVSMHHMVTVSLAAGSITHIFDGTGGSVGNGAMTAYSSN